MVGHLARAESGYQRPLSWDATLTVPGRAPQQAAARRTPSSARREARDADVDILLHRAREADQGERLRRADRAVEAVGALLQPAEGRVQREPQRTGGRGAWRGRVFEPRASAHQFSVPRPYLGVRGHVCDARGVPRSSDPLSRSCRTARAVAASGGGDFSSRAVEPERPPRCPLARRCPRHPWARPRRRERPASPLSASCAWPTPGSRLRRRRARREVFVRRPLKVHRERPSTAHRTRSRPSTSASCVESCYRMSQAQLARRSARSRGFA